MATENEGPDSDESGEKKPRDVIKLADPIQWGKEGELIEELKLKPSARAFKEFALPMKEDGTILFQPYVLAQVGIKMAGHPAAVVDRLSVRDMMAVGTAVMGFIGSSPKI